MISFRRKKPSCLPDKQPLPYQYQASDVELTATSIPHHHLWVTRDLSQPWNCLFPCGTTPCQEDKECVVKEPWKPKYVTFDNAADFTATFDSLGNPTG